jgi:hypothetical protein
MRHTMDGIKINKVSPDEVNLSYKGENYVLNRNGVFVLATQLDDGRTWYSYGGKLNAEHSLKELDNLLDTFVDSRKLGSIPWDNVYTFKMPEPTQRAPTPERTADRPVTDNEGGLVAFKRFCELMGSKAEHHSRLKSGGDRVVDEGMMYGDDIVYETLQCDMKDIGFMEVTETAVGDYAGALRDISIHFKSKDRTTHIGLGHVADDLRVSHFSEEKGYSKTLEIWKNGIIIGEIRCLPATSTCSIEVDQRNPIKM